MTLYIIKLTIISKRIFVHAKLEVKKNTHEVKITNWVMRKDVYEFNTTIQLK